MKILVIRFSSIGDIVLTTPVVRCLKKQVDNAEIHFVTKKKYEGIVATNPYISQVHVLNNNLNELIRELDDCQFDYIIDLHHNFRSTRIKQALKSGSSSFNKLNFRKSLLVWFKIDKMPGVHIVDRYLATVTKLGVKNDFEGLDYFIPAADEFNLTSLPAGFQTGYIVFVIAATWATKKLPVEKVIQICKSIDYPVILLGGKDEIAESEKILEETKGNVISLTGKINLNQSASVVKNAGIVLTNDTGLMHIAAAFKKRILVFWGNTVPAFGMAPYLAHHETAGLEVKNLRCRPCSKLGYSRCPRKHFKCMNDLDTVKAMQWISRNFNAVD